LTIKTLSSLALALSVSTGALAESYKYSIGADYSSGEYGDAETTTMMFLPVAATYTTGNWSFKGSMSLVSLDGPGTADGDSTINTGAANTSSEFGLGDTWLAATYSVEAMPYQWGYLDLGAKVKLPTGDTDKRLGTGEIDYSIQADYFKPLGDVTSFVTLAYKVKNDYSYEDSNILLNNVWYLSLGADYAVSKSLNTGVILDYQQASIDTNDARTELMGYGRYTLSNRWQVMGYGYTGFTDASPDLGVGIQVTYKPL